MRQLAQATAEPQTLPVAAKVHCASPARPPQKAGKWTGFAPARLGQTVGGTILRACVFFFELSLEVLEVDILWPRWVARIGVTRATEACFLAADRQCTELPLLRLPRLVPEVVGCDPFVPRDLARVGWRGLAPFLPIGPHERPRLADSFSRLGQARGASPGSLDQRSEEWPLCEGKSGAHGVRLRPAPSEGGRELWGASTTSYLSPQFITNSCSDLHATSHSSHSRRSLSCCLFP